MSNIEHLLENALIYMERGKDFDEWVSEEETRKNMSENGVIPMSYASFWALANYVRYSYMECYVEKVVEQLKEMAERICSSTNCKEECEVCDFYSEMEAVIKIVRDGGIDDV